MFPHTRHVLSSSTSREHPTTNATNENTTTSLQMLPAPTNGPVSETDIAPPPSYDQIMRGLPPPLTALPLNRPFILELTMRCRLPHIRVFLIFNKKLKLNKMYEISSFKSHTEATLFFLLGKRRKFFNEILK